MILNSLKNGNEVVVIDPNSEYKEIEKVIDDIKILKKEVKDISCTYHYGDENKKINYI